MMENDNLYVRSNEYKALNKVSVAVVQDEALDHPNEPTPQFWTCSGSAATTELKVEHLKLQKQGSAWGVLHSHFL